jgi:hypothetical protein
VSEILPADIGVFTGTTFVRIVPPPTFGVYRIPRGGLVFANADNAERTIQIEIRKGDLAVMIFNDPLAAGEPYAWPFELTLVPEFDGIYGKVTTSPTTQPVWKYEGRAEER